MSDSRNQTYAMTNGRTIKPASLGKRVTITFEIIAHIFFYSW